MILGAALAKEAKVEDSLRFVFFPLVVHGFDIIVSALGIILVRASKRDDEGTKEPDPMKAMRKGYLASLGLSLCEFTMVTYWCLSSERAPGAWIHFAFCGLVGKFIEATTRVSSQPLV